MMAESKRFESVYCVLKMKRLNSICLPMPSQSNLELARTKSYTRKLFSTCTGYLTDCLDSVP